MRDGILMAKLSGDISFDEAMVRLKEVMDHAAENHAQRVLVDCLEARGTLSTLERYSLGTAVFSHMQSLGINPRTAIVGTLPEVNGFGLQVANNRGARGARFEDVAEALDWLITPDFGARPADS